MSKIHRPVKELKGFQRIELKAGERKVVSILLRNADLCHWDEDSQAWMLEQDKIVVAAGGSSDNLPLKAEAELMAVGR